MKGNLTSGSSPEFDDASLTRSIAENTAADVNVGAVIPAATDTDSGDTLTYTMEGTDAASFNFNATTRQITTKAGVTYDFETKPNYLVTIKVEDNNGDTDTVAVTITLTDVNEMPSAPAMASSLVSNLGQTEAVSAPLSSFDTIQGFLTGAGGYTLTSVQLRLKRLTVGDFFQRSQCEVEARNNKRDERDAHRARSSAHRRGHRCYQHHGGELHLHGAGQHHTECVDPVFYRGGIRRARCAVADDRFTR